MSCLSDLPCYKRSISDILLKDWFILCWVYFYSDFSRIIMSKVCILPESSCKQTEDNARGVCKFWQMIIDLFILTESQLEVTDDISVKGL